MHLPCCHRRSPSWQPSQCGLSAGQDETHHESHRATAYFLSTCRWADINRTVRWLAGWLEGRWESTKNDTLPLFPTPRLPVPPILSQHVLVGLVRRKTQQILAQGFLPRPKRSRAANNCRGLLCARASASIARDQKSQTQTQTDRRSLSLPREKDPGALAEHARTARTRTFLSRNVSSVTLHKFCAWMCSSVMPLAVPMKRTLTLVVAGTTAASSFEPASQVRFCGRHRRRRRIHKRGREEDGKILSLYDRNRQNSQEAARFFARGGDENGVSSA